MKEIKQLTKEFLKKELPNIKVGDVVKVSQKIKEGDKERLQVFEGIVLAIKHGRGIQGTITVRRIISGIGVERIFPLHSPLVEKIEIVSRGKVRRAKLYYLRDRVGKKAKIRRKDYTPGEENINEKGAESNQSSIVNDKPQETPVSESQTPEEKKE